MIDRLPDAAVAALKQLRDDFLEGRWDALHTALGNSQFSIKGNVTTAAAFRRYLETRQFVLSELIMEALLSLEYTTNRITLSGRFAIIGRRGPRELRDGIICDTTLALVKAGETWTLTNVQARCPPEWALWRNRPNPQAPIDYANAAESGKDGLARRGIRDGCPL